jgi:transcriptional repressor of dcmA and dcmR
MPSVRDDELLDIKEAADFLKVSETSLRRWTNSGRLRCLRVGRRRERRFRRADLLAFVEHPPGVEARAARSGDATGHSAHLLGVYGTDRGRAQVAASFLADGLREGRRCFLVATPVIQAEVIRQLRDRHPAAWEQIDEEGLELSEFGGSVDEQIDYLETRFDEAVRRGATSLCVVGDVLAFKEAVTMDGLVEYEARYDERIAHRFPVVALCQFDARGFSAADMLGALKTHPDTFRYPTDRLLA